MTQDFVPETKSALDALGQALVAQLDWPNREEWKTLEFTAAREVIPPYGETHRTCLTVSVADGNYPLLPRPAAFEALAELDRVSTLGGRPCWCRVKLLLTRDEEAVSFKCWWEYDERPNSNGPGMTSPPDVVGRRTMR
jgi:hypothetical protein